MHKSPNEVFSAHWPEYLIEGVTLGIFMLSASMFGVLLEHPSSWLHQSIDSSVARRGLMGIAMGATAVSLILSPWGQRSGAHMNPSVTLAYASLGKISPVDATFYISAQLLGAIGGMQVANFLLAMSLRHAAVNYVVTVPGPAGWPEALAAEFVISVLLMTTVLLVSNSRFSSWTPFFAGSLVALYILLEAPISGMSMNPARTLGSGFAANYYPALWIYFVAPPLGMVTAAQLFRLTRGLRAVYCAKLHHDNAANCIFRCRFHEKDPHERSL
jgi:aquaporin Z